jgi:hypothetical protein
MAWTLVQSQIGEGSAEATSTTITGFSATGAGNLLIVNMACNALSDITSITGSSESWTDAGNSWQSTNPSDNWGLDTWYVLSSVGGDTSYTVNHGSEAARSALMMEFSYTAGPISLGDVQGRQDDTDSGANAAGEAVTLGAGNALIVQHIGRNTDPTAIDGSYTRIDRRSGVATGYWVDATDGSAPTWTAAAGGQRTTASAEVFEEAVAGGADVTWITPSTHVAGRRRGFRAVSSGYTPPGSE